MKVSVIIPVFNTEEYLKECLESALNQTYKNIEIIAVNDGSTDNSIEILKQFSDIIKIIDKKNGGAASARNAGIKTMTGEWVKFLDSDDILYPDCIEILINEAKKLGTDSTSRIFYGHYDVIDEEGKKKYEFFEPNYNNLTDFESNVLLLDHYRGHGGTCLLHKSIFEKYGYFNEEIGFVEDYEFWLRACLLHGIKLHLVPKILTKYRIHPTQVTQTKRKIQEKNNIIVRNMVLNQMNSEIKRKYKEALKKFQANKYSTKTRLARHARDIIIAILPESISSKLVNTMKSSSFLNQIYQNEMSSWERKS